jgi:hypothetical protein
MAEAIVKTNEIKFNGREFWRGGSESVELGDIGEIRTPLGKPSWFESKDRIAGKKLKVKNLGNITIDSKRTSKLEFLGSIKIAKVFPMCEGSQAYESVVERKLELMYLELETDDVVDAINSSPGLREKLKDFGNDARICTGIFVVVNAETRKRFEVNTSNEAEFTIYGLTFNPKVNASAGGDTTIKIEKGRVFGYAIAKCIWDEPKPKNAKRLKGVRFDNHT